MARAQNPLELRVPQSTVSEVAKMLRASGKTDHLDRTRLIYREDGIVRLKSPTTGDVFSGQLRQDGSDTVLSGEVRKSIGCWIAEGMVTATLLFMAVFSAALAVLFGLADGRDGVAGIVICGGGALLIVGRVVLTRKFHDGLATDPVEPHRHSLARRLGIQNPPPRAWGLVEEISHYEDATRWWLDASLLPLFEKLRAGVPLQKCAAEAAPMTEMFVHKGFTRDDASQAVIGISRKFQRHSPEEQAQVLEELRVVRPHR